MKKLETLPIVTNVKTGQISIAKKYLKKMFKNVPIEDRPRIVETGKKKLYFHDAIVIEGDTLCIPLNIKDYNTKLQEFTDYFKDDPDENKESKTPDVSSEDTDNDNDECYDLVFRLKISNDIIPYNRLNEPDFNFTNFVYNDDIYVKCKIGKGNRYIRISDGKSFKDVIAEDVISTPLSDIFVLPVTIIK